MQISPKRTTGKNGLTYLGAVGPDADLGAHQVRKGAAATKSFPGRPGERDLRKELGLGDAHLGICGNEQLLRFANIRPSLEQRGRQTWRHVRRKRLLGQCEAARYAPGVIAQQDVDRILLLTNLPLEVRDLRV